MNRSIVAAAALLAGIVIAAPLAWSADQPPPSEREMPGTGQGMRGGPHMGGMHDDGGMGMIGGMPEHDGTGPGRRHGSMHEMMMHRMMHESPQQRCEERLAQRAAIMAYTGAKLKLTAEQRPIWDKLNTTLQGLREKQQQFCDTLKASGERGQATVLDRMSRAEQRLSTRLEALHQLRPVLEQLYQALTSEQKAVIDHVGMRG